MLELLGVTDTELLIEIMEVVADRDTVEALAFVDRLYGRGINWTQFINDLLRHLRRLFLLQNVGHGATDPQVVRALAQTVGLHEQLIERLEPQASRLDPGIVIRLMELLGQALGEIKAGLDGRLQLELALVKVTRPQFDLSLEGLDARLRQVGGRRRSAGPAATRRGRGAAAPAAQTGAVTPLPAAGPRPAPGGAAGDRRPPAPAAPRPRRRRRRDAGDRVAATAPPATPPAHGASAREARASQPPPRAAAGGRRGARGRALLGRATVRRPRRLDRRAAADLGGRRAPAGRRA